MKLLSTISVLITTALLFFFAAVPGFGRGGEVFSVREYEAFHEVLHPLEHEALPKKDFERIRSKATELIKLGKEIVKLGVPRGTAEQQVEDFKQELRKFSAALDRFSADAQAGTDEKLERSYSAVHDSFEMLAGMLPRRKVQWSSFRGEQAAGIAEGQDLPEHWDGEKGVNIKWKTKIPGLAHSSPIVWGDRVFVTTAISSRGGDNFRHGLYGDGTASEDRSVHQWKLYALDKESGKILWERTAYKGLPREKRHIKASYANSTPATDGRYVIAFFGSQGLYAFDMNGHPVWKKDLGILNAGAYDAPDYEWGTASSPIIYKDLVIVQCDTQHESFLLAADIKNGNTVWKTKREELPSWGTPTVYPGKNRVELVTNASNFIRGYDPNTGKELWRLGGSSKITAPTPVFSGDLIVVASGRRPEAPIFVIRAGASGDITLEKGQSANKHVVWSKQARGSYMPTPLIYGNYLYVLSNQGVLDCYDLQTGGEIYRQRISHRGGGFSASPVAADGKIYLPSEDGEMFVVKAGPKFEGLATNSMGELIMATPAISDGKMFVRSQHYVFAISR
jgi:outer membrane protein assembly factor BamB